MVTWCRLSGDSDQKSHIAVGEPFLFQLVELPLEPRRLEHEHVGRFLSIRRIELEDIPRHALLELRARAIDLPSCRAEYWMSSTLASTLERWVRKQESIF
jgi:hypothetical protein